MKRKLAITRESAVLIARAAALVPSTKRRAFVKGVLVGLSGRHHPDRDAVAQACWTGWLNVGLVPRTRQPGFYHPMARAA